MFTKNVNVSQFRHYLPPVNNPESVFYQADEDVQYFNEIYLNGEFQVMFSEIETIISYYEVHKGCSQINSGEGGGSRSRDKRVFQVWI